MLRRDQLTAMDLLDRAVSLRDILVALRREVHANPELGFEETRTGDLVQEVLTQLDGDFSFRKVAKTGVLAGVPGDGRTILLRASLDALPIKERSDAEYASHVEGVCHACGHDGQVAVLVGALAILAGVDRGVRIEGFFQPAEEIDAGAKAALEEGLLDEVRPDVALGFHGHPALDAGTVGVKAGPIMASITTVRCTIEGREGHGAEPHLAADAVTAAASLVLDWQVALARRVDPRQPVVLSIGRLSSGVTPNVVPGHAEIEGTLRSLDPAIEPDLQRILNDVARGVEVRTGTSISLRMELVVPAVVNDAGVASAVAQAAVDVLGDHALVEATPTLGGDDFAWLLHRVPGCYFFIGERQQGRPPYGWHDPAYDLDEDALVYGAAALAGSAIVAAEVASGTEVDKGTTIGARGGRSA